MLFHPKENDIIIKGNYLIHSRPIKLILTTFQAHVLTYYTRILRPTDRRFEWRNTDYCYFFFMYKDKKKIKQNYWKSLNFPFCAGSTANKYTTHTQALSLCYIFIVFYVYLFKILLWNLFFSLRFTFKTSSRNLFFGTLTLTLFSVPCRSFFVCLAFKFKSN